MPWLAFPPALLALPLILLLPRGPGRAFRRAALALLIVAAAQPQRPLPNDGVAVLIDVSASVGEAGWRAAEPFLATLGDAASVYAFAGDTGRANDTGPTRGGGSPAEALAPERTDLRRALAVATASGAARVLLVSDGRDASLGAPPANPIPVDVVAVASVPNARFEALLAPERATPGATLEASAVVALDEPAQVTLHAVAGGVPSSRTWDLPAGRHTLPIALGAPAPDDDGTVRIDARLEVDRVQPRQDDLQSAIVTVDARPIVFVVGDAAAAALLRAQGFDVREVGPEAIRAPLEASAVVLRSGVDAFTPGQLDVLARYVTQGGGLLMTGGPASFGLGQWYRTPVDAVLPVSSDVRGEIAAPSVAMAIVLDVSQSMATGSPSRLDLAKRGIVDLIDLAYPEDRIGLITFSDPATTRWAFDLRPATSAGKRAMRDATLAVVPEGGTLLLPGYREAIAALRGSGAAIAHAIVLSDGKLYDGQGPFAADGAPDWRQLAAAARAEGITTSAVAIGLDADTAALRALAAGGGGRYHEALDVQTLPRLFVAEALAAVRDLLRREVVAPIGRRHPLSDFVGAAPVVSAWTSTTLSPRGEAVFTVDGEPLLAVGRAGLGRSAALTTDLSAGADAFGRWTALPGILGGVVRWLQARPERATTSVSVRDGALEVVVDVVEAGTSVDGLALRALLGGTSVDLLQVGPGRYRGALPIRGDGGTLVVSDGAEVLARRAAFWPDPEFAPVDGAAALAEIAARSGGRVLTSWEAPAARSRAAPLWPVAALLALALTLAEFAWRRYGSDSSGTSTSRWVSSRRRVVA